MATTKVVAAIRVNLRPHCRNWLVRRSSSRLARMANVLTITTVKIPGRARSSSRPHRRSNTMAATRLEIMMAEENKRQTSTVDGLSLRIVQLSRIFEMRNGQFSPHVFVLTATARIGDRKSQRAKKWLDRFPNRAKCSLSNAKALTSPSAKRLAAFHS